MTNRFAREYESTTRCAKCGGAVTVYDTRAQKYGVWRRRGCADCGHRWSTVEIDMIDYKRMRRAAEALGEALEAMESSE